MAITINRDPVSPAGSPGRSPGNLNEGRPVASIGSVENTDTAVLARSSFSWRAVFAGAFVSFLIYLVLTALGLAVGGAKLKGIIGGTSGAHGLGIGSGIWLIVSTIIALYIGSYIAGRIAGFVPIRVGRAQGMVIASLFFLFMIAQVGGLLGSLGEGLGKSLSTLGGAAGDVAKDSRVQDTIENALGGLNLKSPPTDVAQGIAVRLLKGDPTSAKNYLANQAGISPAEADRRITDAYNNFQKVMTDIGTTTAKVISVTGWFLFATFLLGMVAGSAGGAVGARMNLLEPVSESDREAIRRKAA